MCRGGKIPRQGRPRRKSRRILPESSPPVLYPDFPPVPMGEPGRMAGPFRASLEKAGRKRMIRSLLIEKSVRAKVLARDFRGSGGDVVSPRLVFSPPPPQVFHNPAPICGKPGRVRGISPAEKKKCLTAAVYVVYTFNLQGCLSRAKDGKPAGQAPAQ